MSMTTQESNKLLTRLQALKLAIESLAKSSDYGIPQEVGGHYFKTALAVMEELKSGNPDSLNILLPFVPSVYGPNSSLAGNFNIQETERFLQDIELTVRLLGVQDVEAKPILGVGIFITHGRDEQWRRLQPYLEKQLGIPTVELSQQAYRGRHTLTKLDEESNACNYAIVVMTGDDELKDESAPRRARENVIHEIGFFQAKFGIERVCLMYEEGTSIPSNIDGLGRVQFPKGRIEAGFSDLHRELQEFFDV